MKCFHGLNERDPRGEVPSFWFLQLWSRCELSQGIRGFVGTEALNWSAMNNLFWGHHKLGLGLQWVPRTLKQVIRGGGSATAL